MSGTEDYPLPKNPEKDAHGLQNKIPWETAGNFLICWIGWFVFVSALWAIKYEFLTVERVETATVIIIALFFTVWWLLVIKRR